MYFSKSLCKLVATNIISTIDVHVLNSTRKLNLAPLLARAYVVSIFMRLSRAALHVLVNKENVLTHTTYLVCQQQWLL